MIMILSRLWRWFWDQASFFVDGVPFNVCPMYEDDCPICNREDRQFR
jgi:hypothetical protein